MQLKRENLVNFEFSQSTVHLFDTFFLPFSF